MVALVEFVEEDDRFGGPDTLDVLQLVQSHVAEVFERVATHQQHEVEAAGGDPEPFDAGKRAQPIAQIAPQSLSDVDQDERRHRHPDIGRLHARREARDRARLDEPIESAVRRGASDREMLGEHRSGHPTVGTEQVDHPTIDLVEFGHETNVDPDERMDADRPELAQSTHRTVGEWHRGHMATTTAQARLEPPESYWQRRRAIAERAAGLDHPPATIEYTDAEHEVWATVSATLAPLWERHAAADVLAARDRLALPTDRLAQLGEVDAALRPLTGFGYRAVAGLVPSEDFFAGLARGIFSSTQYVRWDGAPLYTPEPDVIHEVIGHANCLACPEIAELHRLAGQAIGRVRGDRQRQFLYDVFWFSAEFGVVRSGLGDRSDDENVVGDRTGAADGVKAYGAGLLSSPGELEWFGDHAAIRPLDLVQMGRIGYDIDEYQPVLFAGDSLAHVLDVVGGFFADATDESVGTLLSAPM